MEVMHHLDLHTHTLHRQNRHKTPALAPNVNIGIVRPRIVHYACKKHSLLIRLNVVLFCCIANLIYVVRFIPVYFTLKHMVCTVHLIL